MTTTIPNIVTKHVAHVKFKYSGPPEMFNAFCYMAGVLDPDFPLGSKKHRRDPAANLLCPTCKGQIYYSPMLTVDDLKSLARQVSESPQFKSHLKLKIKMFTYDPDCAKVQEEDL